MSIKHALLLSAVFTLFNISPTYSGNIISCDSFETCPDGVTCSALIVELEAEVVAKTADLSDATLTNAKMLNANLTNVDLYDANLTGVTWSNTTCPDGSNSDTNGLDACVPL